jgi:Concanavalin A-like lectin/glucanases superfamily
MAVQSNASDIHLRSSQAMGLQATTPFTVTVWINVANWGIGSRRSYVGIYGGTTDTPLAAPVTAMQIGTTAGGNTLDCWTWGGTNLVGTGAIMAPFNNVWVHIAYTYDGTNHRVYLNGAQQATATTAQTAGFLNQVYINGFPTGVTNEVAAYQIDQYGLYRRALSANEVLTLYTAAGARHGIKWQQVCRYEFDEGVQAATVVSCRDLSGNGHNLTVEGAGTSMTYAYPATYANSNIRPVL